MKNTKNMKLYYWNDVEILGYYSGEVIVMANSLKEALEQVKKEQDERIAKCDYEDEDVYKEIKKKKPIVYYKATAIFLNGCD